MAKDKYIRNLNKGIVVSKQDYYLLEKYYFSLDTKGYPYATIQNKTVLLHKMIMGKKGVLVDHKDRNPLNNTRNNLRYCNFSQNRVNSKLGKNNTSGYRNIQKDKTSFGVCWKVVFQKNGVKINGGCHYNLDLALKVRNIMAKQLFGDFAIEETKKI